MQKKSIELSSKTVASINRRMKLLINFIDRSDRTITHIQIGLTKGQIEVIWCKRIKAQKIYFNIATQLAQRYGFPFIS